MALAAWFCWLTTKTLTSWALSQVFSSIKPHNPISNPQMTSFTLSPECRTFHHAILGQGRMKLTIFSLTRQLTSWFLESSLKETTHDGKLLFIILLQDLFQTCSQILEFKVLQRDSGNKSIIRFIKADYQTDSYRQPEGKKPQNRWKGGQKYWS
jgi:hypothetical protein